MVSEGGQKAGAIFRNNHAPQHFEAKSEFFLMEWRHKVKRLTVAAAALLVMVSLFAVTAVADNSVSEENFRQYYHLPQAPEPLVREILSRDEFQQSPLEKLVDHLLNRLGAALNELLSRLFKKLSLPRGFTIDRQISWAVVMGVLLSVLALAAVLGLWYAVKKFRSEPPKLGRESGTNHDYSFGTANSSDMWDQALKTAEQAKYAEALVLLFRFLVLRLHEKGLLSFHLGKTNREILDSLGPVPFRDILGELVLRFNRVRYGRGGCGKADYEEFLMLCRQVSQQI